MDILHVRLLSLNLCISGPDPGSVFPLLFKENPGAPLGMADQPQKYRQHNRHCYYDLDNSVLHHFRADGTDLVADHIFPNQDGQHPVRALHRNITEFFRRLPVSKGNMPRFSGFKISFKLIIIGILFHPGFLKRGKNILACRKIAEIIISQTLSIAVIQITISLIIVGLQCQRA